MAGSETPLTLDPEPVFPDPRNPAPRRPEGVVSNPDPGAPK